MPDDIEPINESCLQRFRTRLFHYVSGQAEVILAAGATNDVSPFSPISVTPSPIAESGQSGPIYWVENGLFANRTPLISGSHVEIGLHTDAGISSSDHIAVSGSAGMRTGIHFENDENRTAASFFSEQNIGAATGGGFVTFAQRSSPSSGTYDGIPIGAGANLSGKLKFQQHWRYDTNKVKTLAVGALISTAHTAGAIIGGISAAPVGLMHQGAAAGAAIGAGLATTTLAFLPPTRPDKYKLILETQANVNSTLRVSTGLTNEFVGATLQAGCGITFEKEFNPKQPIHIADEFMEAGIYFTDASASGTNNPAYGVEYMNENDESADPSPTQQLPLIIFPSSS